MFFPNESYFNVNDGVLGALAFDDQKPMAAWSHYHADALAARLTQCRSRLSAAEWRAADTSARLNAYTGASDLVRQRLQQCVSAATTERDAFGAQLAMLLERARIMDTAREADSYAPKESPFDLTGEGQSEVTAGFDAPLVAE